VFGFLTGFKKRTFSRLGRRAGHEGPAIHRRWSSRRSKTRRRGRIAAIMDSQRLSVLAASFVCFSISTIRAHSMNLSSDAARKLRFLLLNFFVSNWRTEPQVRLTRGTPRRQTNCSAGLRFVPPSRKFSIVVLPATVWSSMAVVRTSCLRSRFRVRLCDLPILVVSEDHFRALQQHPYSPGLSSACPPSTDY
jgi:hypothetical protein